jgi:hypothetical protein
MPDTAPGCQESVKTLTYSQTWPVADQQPRQDQVDSVFDTAEVAWLIQQGFAPTHSQRAIPYRAHWVYTVTFRVPDEILTYINLRWPDTRTTVEVASPD